MKTLMTSLLIAGTTLMAAQTGTMPAPAATASTPSATTAPAPVKVKKHHKKADTNAVPATPAAPVKK